MKKRFLVFCLFCVLCFTLCLPAAADVSVNVRVEGAEKTLYDGAVACEGSGPFTVYDVLTALNSAEDGVKIEGLEYGYITAIEGERVGQTERGWDGFGIRLGSKSVGYDRLRDTTVYSGAKLVVYYADEFGAGLITPKMDTKNIYDGKLAFYSENKEGTGRVVKPIVGATVRWYCDDAFAEYTTDENGCVSVHPSYLTSGKHRVTISLDSEEGVPMILRTESDFSVTVSTAVGDPPTLYITLAALIISGMSLILLIKRRKREER